MDKELDNKLECVCLTNIALEYKVGNIVYLKTDINQLPRMVIGYLLEPFNHQYKLVCGTEESYHYGFEIAPIKNLLQSLGIEQNEVVYD